MVGNGGVSSGTLVGNGDVRARSDDRIRSGSNWRFSTLKALSVESSPSLFATPTRLGSLSLSRGNDHAVMERASKMQEMIRILI